MRFLPHLLIAATMLTASNANAAFTYQSRPVSPQCLSQLIDMYDVQNPKVKLSECSAFEDAHNVHVIDGIVTTEDKTQVEPAPYANYSVIGEEGDKYLIGMGQWTGGSGFFSSILWVQIMNGELQVIKTVASGDRCNGGAYKSGLWQFTVNLTSADLIDYAKDKAIKIQPYIDLDASAAGCIAKAHYMFHPNNATTRLMYVKLDQNAVTTGEWEKQFVTQHCFNEIMAGYLQRKQTELTMDGVKQFAKTFQQQCLRNPEDIN